MKTIIILLACIACLVGCNPPMTSSDYIKNNYEVVVVDSCEYIFLNRNIEGFSHKGNCKYCRERNNPEWIYGGSMDWVDTASSTMRIQETSDQSLSAPAGSVKLGGTLMPNTTINKKAWTDASKATRDTTVIHYY